MKNKPVNLYDKLMLRKRAIIETVNEQLKNISQIEHTASQCVEFSGKRRRRIDRLQFQREEAIT